VEGFLDFMAAASRGRDAKKRLAVIPLGMTGDCHFGRWWKAHACRVLDRVGTDDVGLFVEATRVARKAVVSFSA
jgi:hypothetical protein